MNCRTAQQKILLKFAGELSALARPRLQRHLARCSACRTFEEDYRRLQDAIRAQQSNADERTVAEVLSYARRAVSRQGSTIPGATWHSAWFYSVISAAAVIVFLLVISPYREPTPQRFAQTSLSTPTYESTIALEPNELAEALEELALWLECSALELITANDADITIWADTERLAKELLQWEEAQI